MIPRILFTASMAFVLYVYLGYPILLALWRTKASRKVRKTNYEPTVSIVVAAYNESAHIERKILNLLALDYPSEKLQIVLCLDAPTDDTEKLARKHESGRIRVLCLKRHAGKAEALNYAVTKATGKILVFADARQLLDCKAVRELVSNFEDLSIGAVTGELAILDDSGKETNDALGLYWRYEKQLRSMESDIHSTMGATGALYAMRRRLYQPIPSHTILDDVAIPMKAVLDGKRVVFDRNAIAFDTVSNSPDAEFNRKVRTLTGNFQLLSQMPELLVPRRNPVFLQFVSHKVGRLLVPYFLITLFASNLFIASNVFRGILGLQCAWYVMAALGSASRASGFGRSSRIKGLALFPYTFVLMNWAAVVGLYRFLLGQRDVWSGAETLDDQDPLHERAYPHDSELSKVA